MPCSQAGYHLTLTLTNTLPLTLTLTSATFAARLVGRLGITNHISVKFKHAEAVADAVGLNGTILPADGLPGENYMIGVKRGAAPMERGAGSSLDAEAAAQRALKSPAVMRPSVAVGAGHDSQRVSEGGLRGSVGRFLSELFDITDLSIRD